MCTFLNALLLGDILDLFFLFLFRIDIQPLRLFLLFPCLGFGLYSFYRCCICLSFGLYSFLRSFLSCCCCFLSFLLCGLSLGLGLFLLCHSSLGLVLGLGFGLYS